jgi:hypothetical protein
MEKKYFTAIRVGEHWRVYSDEVRRFLEEGNRTPEAIQAESEEGLMAPPLPPDIAENRD